MATADRRGKAGFDHGSELASRLQVKVTQAGDAIDYVRESSRKHRLGDIGGVDLPVERERVEARAEHGLNLRYRSGHGDGIGAGRD